MNIRRKGRGYRSSRIQAFWHRIMAVLGRVVYSRCIKQNSDARILVVCHLFYMDAWPHIKCYLENLSSYHYDLVVTYITGHFDEAVLDKVREFKGDVRFKEYENKGFDIGGFIDVLTRTDLNHYDIVFKLQSKGIGKKSIYVCDQVFKRADWFLNLFDGILGEFSVHKAVNILLHSSNSGLVASANLIVQDPLHKSALTRDKADRLCIPIPKEYHFVAGSCFAIKAPLLSRIQDLHLTIDSFEPTRRGSFSLAHALERIICASVETQGQSLVGIHVKHPHYFLERYYYRRVSAIRLLYDDRFSLDYDYFYRSLEMVPVFSYEIKSMRLGDIHRYWEGKYYHLQECSPYAYLHGDIETYEKYIEVNFKSTGFEMSRERFDRLIQSMEENGFDKKRLPIVCAYDNTIWDGQHRCCWLIAKYGEDTAVPVLYLDAYPVHLDTTDISNARKMSSWEKLRRALS